MASASSTSSTERADPPLPSLGLVAVERGLHDSGDGRPGDPPGEEGGHRHLVGRVEPGRGQVAGPAGPVGQVETGEDGPVGRLEFEDGEPGPVDGPEGRGQSGRVGQGVPDGQSHVGQGQLGHHGPVGELDHRVDDRLGMDDHVDGVVGDTEELVGLDDLEALVHQGRGVDRDLRSHRPGRMGQRLVHADRAQLVGAPAPERSPRGGQQQAGDVVGTPGAQALVERAVLRVDRDDLGPGCPAGPRHHRGAGDDRLLVGQGQPPAGLEGGQGDGQAGEPDHAVDRHVGHRRDGGQPVGPGQHLDARGQAPGQLRGE